MPAKDGCAAVGREVLARATQARRRLRVFSYRLLFVMASSEDFRQIAPEDKQDAAFNLQVDKEV